MLTVIKGSRSRRAVSGGMSLIVGCVYASRDTEQCAAIFNFLVLALCQMEAFIYSFSVLVLTNIFLTFPITLDVERILESSASNFQHPISRFGDWAVGFDGWNQANSWKQNETLPFLSQTKTLQHERTEATRERALR